MISNGLFVRIVAKPGKEREVSRFLQDSLPLVNAEKGTHNWYAVQFDERNFGIFDTFATEMERDMHLHGPIANALLANAASLLSQPPSIEKMNILANKS